MEIYSLKCKYIMSKAKKAKTLIPKITKQSNISNEFGKSGSDIN